MDLARLYEETEKRLSRIDFSKLWKGFKPFRFALYTDRECYYDGRYIEKTDVFCANTTISFEGEQIAIWNVLKDPDDMDALCASIVHEMFHAFQQNSGECRFADEREALFKYRCSTGNLSAKFAEAACIRAAMEKNDPDAYSKLLSIRRMRAGKYPYEYEYEARTEQIEGAACYVELNALARLCPEKGCRAWKRVLERISRPENYIPVRIISYDIGAAVIACIGKYTQIDFEKFSELPFSREMLFTGTDDCSPDVFYNAEIERCLESYRAKTRNIIERAVEKNECVLTGPYPLVSVNIYDARCDKNYVVSNHFVAYKDGDEQKILCGDFVVKLDDDHNVLTVLKQ